MKKNIYQLASELKQSQGTAVLMNSSTVQEKATENFRTTLENVNKANLTPSAVKFLSALKEMAKIDGKASNQNISTALHNATATASIIPMNEAAMSGQTLDQLSLANLTPEATELLDKQEKALQNGTLDSLSANPDFGQRSNPVQASAIKPANEPKELQASDDSPGADPQGVMREDLGGTQGGPKLGSGR